MVWLWFCPASFVIRVVWAAILICYLCLAILICYMCLAIYRFVMVQVQRLLSRPLLWLHWSNRDGLLWAEYHWTMGRSGETLLFISFLNIIFRGDQVKHCTLISFQTSFPGALQWEGLEEDWVPDGGGDPGHDQPQERERDLPQGLQLQGAAGGHQVRRAREDNRWVDNHCSNFIFPNLFFRQTTN